MRNGCSWAGAVNFGCDFDSCDTTDDLPCYPCKRQWARMVVLHDGRVPLCAIDSEEEVILGDLRETSIEEVWHGETIRARHLAGRASAVAPCSRCQVRERWW